MIRIEFLKMHGCGNDFIIVDWRGKPDLSQIDDVALITRMADRHFGIGCDQFIIIKDHETAYAEMLVRNNDGSDGRMCGNATRCVADMLMNEKGHNDVLIHCSGRMLECIRLDNGLVRVDMGIPVSVVELDVLPELPKAVAVDMGNPHAVFFLNHVDDVVLEDIGPRVEHHTLFPKRTNVEIVHKIDASTLRMRVWERGTKITLACGSAACATAVAAVTRGIMPRTMTIRMDGGDLNLEWREADSHVLMAGPISYVFNGVMDI